MKLLLLLLLLIPIGLLIIIAVTVAIFNLLFGGSVHRTPQEMADQLEAILSGAVDAWVDEEFLHIPISDRSLDEIRRHCYKIVVDGDYPPESGEEMSHIEKAADPVPWINDEGIAIIRAYIDELRLCAQANNAGETAASASK